MTDVQTSFTRITDLAPESNFRTRGCPAKNAVALSEHRRGTHWGAAEDGQHFLPSVGFKNESAMFLQNASTGNTQQVHKGPVGKERCTSRTEQAVSSQDLILTEASAPLFAGLSREGNLCAGTGAKNVFDSLAGGANPWVPRHLDQRPALSISEYVALTTVEVDESRGGSTAISSLQLNHQSKSQSDYQAPCPQIMDEAVLGRCAASTSTLRLPVPNLPMPQSGLPSYYNEMNPNLMIPPWHSTWYYGPQALVALDPTTPLVLSESPATQRLTPESLQLIPVQSSSVQRSTVPSSAFRWTGYEGPLSSLSSRQPQMDLKSSSITTPIVPNHCLNAYVSACHTGNSVTHAGNVRFQRVASPQEGSFRNRVCPSLMSRPDEDVELAARSTYVGSTGETIVEDSLRYCGQRDQSKRYRALRPTGEVQPGAKDGNPTITNGTRAMLHPEWGRWEQDWRRPQANLVKQERFPCPFCTTSFTRQHGLQRHMHNHWGRKNYRCPLCWKTFVRNDNCAAHVATHVEKPGRSRGKNKKWPLSMVQAHIPAQKLREKISRLYVKDMEKYVASQ
ncbi:hypothetical protein PMIN01_13323 [Paraphaeosphaeria minitans]|uniref:C2H2-type domain-containing protein n=1 Tax=Paraphaeosphaeria minitans TaxID=565426 RepID=A0A9P6G609_9PLEO|nr:hypothetical protein PMIN01_13323 [Paraphaeosphaeria minitans]